MRVHYLQHVENEDLANMEPWLVKRGHSITRTLLYRKHSLPSPGSFDWLIIMGGPMNADEHVKYPWLKKEKAFIKESIGMGKVVLGVCLGAQLIARALGAKVRKNEYKEVGWHRVGLTAAGKRSALFNGFPTVFTPIHWHGDTFAVPEGAKRLASSTACKNQAFEYKGRVFAVQFHIEYAPVHVRDFFRAEGEPAAGGKFEQGEKQILGRPELFKKLGFLMDKMLENAEKAV